MNAASPKGAQRGAAERSGIASPEGAQRGASPDRGRVWKLLGAPTDQVGSVNDPRTHEEHGAKWNEKWVYLGEDGESVERVVLWNRYDFLGVFRVRPDGSAEPEELPGA